MRSLELASPRGREMRGIELSAAGPGDVPKRTFATQPLKIGIVVLRLCAARPRSDDVDPIPAFDALDLRHRPQGTQSAPNEKMGSTEGGASQPCGFGRAFGVLAQNALLHAGAYAQPLMM